MRPDAGPDILFTQREEGYALAGDYDIEAYLPPEEGAGDMKVYIWVPLKKD